MDNITSTQEILDRLNGWEERHQADPESVLDIWQEVILPLPDYDDEATAASPYANNTPASSPLMGGSSQWGTS